MAGRSKNEKNPQKIKELTDREWLLIRGHNIIGSLQPVKQRAYLFNNKINKFEWTEYEFIPGLLKIINEIIDNSIDVAIKSSFTSGTQISVVITKNKVQVTDNGYGIPVEKNSEGVYLPEVAWGRARAGSNFDDDENRVSIGMNGIGSFATTVFSKKFIGVTDDGKHKAKVAFKNNAESCEVEILKSSGTSGTTVTFWPDLERFGITEIDELHQSLIYQRLLNLSVSYPEIKFKFNKRLIKTDPKKFISMFNNSFEVLAMENFMIGVLPNESSDFNYHTYVNGLWLEKGGNHLDFLTGKIVDALREKLIRRYKNIKPGDIKNKLAVVIFFRDFQNPKFDGQTKEFLTNTQKEITSYLGFNEPLFKKIWSKFIDKIYKNKNILAPVIDLYNAKMVVEEKKKLRDAVKKISVSSKYWPAKKAKKYLFLSEGDSAIRGITSELGRDYFGFFPLKGVTVNPIKDASKIIKNAEMQQISKILNIGLTDRSDSLAYENIVIATDMDKDGAHIAGLLLGFLWKYTTYLEQGRVFRFVTPLMVAVRKNEMHFFFTMEEYNKFRGKNDPTGNKYKYLFKKGLGNISEEEWAKLFELYKIEELLVPLHLKDSSDKKSEIEMLINWLNEDTDFRKSKILPRIRDFDINAI